jgi:hypothetical protein
MQRTNYEDRRMLPNVSAVYVVRSEQAALYVGSTWTLRQRLVSHNKREAFEANGAIFIDWVEVTDEQLEETEKRFVREFMPTLNKLAHRTKVKKVQKTAPVGYPKQTNWRDFAVSLLQQHLKDKPLDKTLAEVAKEINVSISWLKLMAKGKIDNPGTVTIETLIEFLKNYNKKA